MAAALELLEALAETPPKAFLQRQSGGQSTLRELHAQAAQAGLCPAAANDDIARLHALFDVALDHGMGGIVSDYIAEVCADRLLTSSDPVEALLLDVECVRRWVQKLLAVSRGRLASWLGRGLASLGSAGVLPRELARLQMLQLVAEALQPPRPEGAAASAAAAAAAAAPESAELAEAGRLVRCARVLTWLAGAQLAFDRPTGRFFSEQEWRSVAAKRRDGAAAAAGGTGLFLADLSAELAGAGVDALAYPPPSADRLLSTLFLGGAAASAGGSGGERGLHVRLALLAYYLSDGGFMQPADIVQGLQAHFHVPPATAHAWLLQQLLDDAHTADPGGAASLARAAELAPRCDGAALPHKALQVFAARGRLDVALALLRQRPESATGLEEASVALAVRLRNGLLGEGFLGLRRHLEAVGAAAPSPAAAAEAQRRHARLLVGQLLQFAALAQPSTVNAVTRMPLGVHEEEAAISWLEGQAREGTQEAALMLPLFFLLRGRTPEALHAYAAHCPQPPASREQQELSGLLAEAARMLPPPQRALVVQLGPTPALLRAAAGQGGEEAGGVALMGALPDLSPAGSAAPALVSVGPSLSEAPLVGSIPVLLEQQRLAAAAAQPAAQDSEQGGDVSPRGAAAQQRLQQPQPMLFGRPAGEGAPAAGGGGFGAATAASPMDEPMAPAGPAGRHEMDRVLGLGGTPRGAKGKRRLGGSAYR